MWYICVVLLCFHAILFFNRYVPLGVLLLNENKNEEMIQILQNLHKYVPAIERDQEIFIPSQEMSIMRSNTMQHKLIFGGDQLTVARVRGAQVAMCNGSTLLQRPEGLIPIIQDWHAEVILAEVCTIKLSV